jgi:EAL domain-containing protein (putative c-di-GMP-specific phosphodiesterase class I)/DNA-binding response OmpR family regulator
MAMMERRRLFRSQRKPMVLVLDDDESIGRYVRTALPENWFRTEWAPTVERAVEAIGRHIPDVALIDISLHDESGWEVLKYIRSRPETARTPVVMLCGSADTLDRLRSLVMGADHYLVKPVLPETLRRVIKESLATHDDIWSTMNLRSEQVNRLRELFFDATTEVPTLALVVDDLKKIVERNEVLQVFCLEIEPLFSVGERVQWEALDALRREFVRGLHVMIAPILGNDVMIATSHSGANDFYCFVRGGEKLGDQTKVSRDLERAARTVVRSTNVDPTIADEVTTFVGGAVTQPQELFAPRILYNAVREAKHNAERRETRYYSAMRERLVRAIRERSISTVFQPVIDLATRDVVGFEALSRGPAGTEIEKPEVMFELARDFDLVWDLESLCIENIHPMLAEICSRGYLFFNLESHFIQQLQQRGSDIFDSFFDCHQQVVIEVTERSAIRDYRTFRRTLHHLKAMGFKIAIDDCGSGYSSLEAVAELQPDYLKVGHSLFRGIEKDPIRRRLVDLVARAADTIGAKTIAEAVETEEQLQVCRDLRIQEAQGFLFAKPAPWEVIRNFRIAERQPA